MPSCHPLFGQPVILREFLTLLRKRGYLQPLAMCSCRGELALKKGCKTPSEAPQIAAEARVSFGYLDVPIAAQEFMILPTGCKTFSEALRAGAEVYHALKGIIKKKYGQVRSPPN